MTFVVNAYAPGAVNDRFPVNTWAGDEDAVIDCVRNLLRRSGRNGISRVEVVLKPEHPAYSVGQNPMPLESTVEVIGDIMRAATESGFTRTAACCEGEVLQLGRVEGQPRRVREGPDSGH
jgi:hypothetical protein